ncbi:hypothetical protein BCV69DRAFT_295410 [Microstroma glucosiphilum]|uniref:Uncharacterized protein n=1 Tax=Pseudomicrostroma glucosiphilum TaxID=1684307 RepID=A0A316TYY0_9BASI|nr:hypothetical protein BCV69DRAFT_295410 [Pseudomicrostroma glucosiphilum]PWN18260.1 hypothetical protein BCV69DRAFT_295410 [Pseudomicrostroma glucosiphilum]
MVRPTAVLEKLKVAQRATRTVPQLAFARPSKPQNPLHLYRQALRLAYQIAKRWYDPYIFYYHRLKAARQLRAPSSISKAHVARTKWTKEKVESTMSPAEVNRFKRLKACVSTLKRAELGHLEPMYKVLRETYARSGVLRATAMEHLLPNLDPSNTIPQPTWAVLKLIQSPITSSSSPDATTIRNLRRYTRLNPAIAAGEEPPRIPLEERKLRNRMQFKVFGKVMDGIRPPLSYAVVRKVEENARRAVSVALECPERGQTIDGVQASQDNEKDESKWAEQDFSQGGQILKDALQALGTRPRRGPPKPLELGPLHPSSKWYARGRRRAWVSKLVQQKQYRHRKLEMSRVILPLRGRVHSLRTSQYNLPRSSGNPSGAPSLACQPTASAPSSKPTMLKSTPATSGPANPRQTQQPTQPSRRSAPVYEKSMQD